jgi:hypothetical protein
MEDKHLSLPSPGKTVSAVSQAFQIAREKLSQVEDVAELCRKSGANYTPDSASRSINIEYVGRPYVVFLHNGEITSLTDSLTLSAREQLLILHYLNTAKGTPLSGKLITFQELPEGHVYYPTFLKRSVQPLVSNFGSEPGILSSLAEKLGGQPTKLGDVSIVINAFSNVPITIVIWQGDDEFEARGSILFDAAISDYLPTEDITILCETISWRLVKLKPTK